MHQHLDNIPEHYLAAFIRVKNGEDSAADRSLLAEITDKHSEFYDTFRELERLWTKLELYPGEIAFDLDKYKSSLPTSVSSHNSANRPRQFVFVAALVLLTGLFSFSYIYKFGSESYSTGRGERTVISLADNSVVHLNTDTKVSIRFDRNIRRINLQRGEALFEVARDEHRKFVVYSNKGRVEALGTSFNVNALTDQFIVTVVEGSVVVSNTEKSDDQHLSQVLIHGEQIAINREGEIHSARLDNVDPIISWSRNKLVFSGEKLTDVVEKLNRYTRHRIRIEDARLENLRIYGVFNAGDTRGFLAALEKSYPVHQIFRTSEITELVYTER